MLKELSDAVCVGDVAEACEVAVKYLGEFCEIKRTRDGSYYGLMNLKTYHYLTPPILVM